MLRRHLPPLQSLRPSLICYRVRPRCRYKTSSSARPPPPHRWTSKWTRWNPDSPHQKPILPPAQPTTSPEHPTTRPEEPARPREDPIRDGRPYAFISSAIAIAKYAAGICLFTHIFITYFYCLELTDGISMNPTLRSADDWVLISKYYRRGRGLSVGDVISFRHPVNNGGYAAKRILGMPGDFVLLDIITPDDEETAEGRERMLQVPEGHCWVVGDNLPWSRDSRLYGPVPLALVTGKVIKVLSPGLYWWFRDVENTLQPAEIERDDDQGMD